ncbi:MAG: PQQ-binding-like beta-propeller repeat protein [Deltaproteobacteria bacterium]|nr:PQQ-binding-like beta-propeller repeat protein [Deltaproteobacteria bacterium]
MSSAPHEAHDLKSTVCACGLATLWAASVSASEPDWRQSRGDPGNQARFTLESKRTSVPRPWTFEGSGRTWGYEPGMTVWSSAAIASVGGRTLLAVGNYDHDVYGLDATTGQLVYSFTTGGRVQSAPTIWNDGARSWLFVASNDRVLYALDATNGRQAWVHAVERYSPTLGGARLTSPTVGEAGERPAVFVGHWVWDRALASSFQRAELSAFDARQGKPLWRVELGDNELTAPVFISRGGRRWIVIGSSTGALFGIDADSGRVKWRHTELDAIRSAPAVFDVHGAPLVFVTSKYGAVRALELETAKEVWVFKTGDRILGSPLVAELEGRPRVFVGSYDGGLYSLDASTGALLWRYSAKAGIHSSPSIALEGDRAIVLASAWDHALHAVSAKTGELVFASFTGRPLWAVSGLDASVWASPVSARLDGRWMSYLGSYDGTLRAIPLDEAGRSAPPERSNVVFWLTFPAALTPTLGLAFALTRRHRRESSRRVSPSR